MQADERLKLIGAYRSGHATIMALLTGLGGEALDTAPDGDWSVRQIAHHLADTEVVRAARLRRLLSQDDRAIQAIDETLLAERAHYSRPIEASLALFDAAVRSTLELLDLMTEEDWAKEGTHSEFGAYSMHYWLARSADHLPQHADQISRTLKSAALQPSMITVEPLPRPGLEAWLAAFLERHGSTRIVSRGRLHYPASLSGFVALRRGEPVALATYRFEADACEIVTLHSDVESVGGGSALVDAVRTEAARANCRRLWLVTTNDNTHAIGFYQRRGFRIAAVHVRAVDELGRRLKPEIPLAGKDGIPISDEIEFELLLPR